jgi:putative redox protein
VDFPPGKKQNYQPQLNQKKLKDKYIMRKVEAQFGVGPLQQKMAVGDLHFLSDAEESNGGAGTGPSPHEYLAAALAACTAMTLKMYSGRKGWELKNAIVTVNAERVDDVEKITRNIELFGNLDAEQKERLLDIANKCPIHKALTGEIQIKTQLVN